MRSRRRGGAALCGLWLALAALLVHPRARAAELVPPTLEVCPEVAYPAGVDRGPQAVELLIELDERGQVAAVLEAEGEEPFVDLVRDAVAECRFTPAREAGRPVPVQLPFTWRFPEPPVRLSGVVRTRGDRKTLAGITVAVGDRTTTTDEEGRWAVRGVAPGALQIRVADPRYRMEPVEVELGGGETLSVELWVLADGRVNEVVGTYDARGGPVRRPLTPEEVRATPGSLGDPIRALHSRPGMARTPFDAGWLLVRGGDFDDTGLFLDGVRMPLLFHLGGFTSLLHPEMTETVRFWPGLQPPRYQANAGAVDVVPREIGDDPRVVAGVNTVFAHAFAEAPLRLGDRQGGLAVAARRSYLDGVMSIVLDPERARIAPRFWDGQAHLQLGRTHVLLLGLSDSFDAPAANGLDIVTVTQEGFQLQGRTELDLGAGTLTVAPWFAVHSRGLAGDAPEQRVTERFPGVRIEARSGPRSPLRLLAGVEAQQGTFHLRQEEDRRSAPTASVAPYLSLGTGDRVSLETGMRLDTLFVRGQLPRVGPSPRAAVRWRITDHLAWTGEVGRTHQGPVSTLLLGLSEGTYLPLERVDTVGTGVELSGRSWMASVGAYRRTLADVTGIELDGSVGTFDGRSRGVETALHWAPGPLDLSVLYQIGRAELQEEPTSDLRPAPFDQTHRFETTALLALPQRWTLSGRFRWSSGFPRRPGDPPSPTRAYDLLTQQNVQLGLPDDQLRLTPFHALDVKAAKTFTFRTWELDAWLDVQNIYNRRVVEPLITGFAESEPSYGFGLPILPVFGVEGRFWP